MNSTQVPAHATRNRPPVINDLCTPAKPAEITIQRELLLNTALADLTAHLTDPSIQMRQFGDAVLHWSKIITGSDHGYVSYINPDTGNMIISSATSMMENYPADKKLRILFPRGSDGAYNGLWGHSLNVRKPFFTNNPSVHESSAGVPGGHLKLKNFLSVPAMIGDSPAGQISLANAPGDYTGRDLSAITLIARLWALSVQHANNEKKITQAAEHFERKVAERTREMERANEKLLSGVQALLKTEEMLKASLGEKELYLKEIHHRVKNNMQILSSLVDLEAMQVPDDETARLLQKTKERIFSMAKVHEKLFTADTRSLVDFREYSIELVAGMLASYAHREKIQIAADIGEIYLGVQEAVPCGLILNEIVTNSIKYAFPGGMCGTISISFKEDMSGRYTLTISDNGVGLPGPDELSSRATLGLELIHALARQIRGTVTLERESGTAYTIVFPGGAAENGRARSERPAGRMNDAVQYLTREDAMEEFRVNLMHLQVRLVNFYEELKKVSNRDLYCLLMQNHDEFKSIQKTFNNLADFITDKFPDDETVPLRPRETALKNARVKH